jgi:sugar phosphate isomerase/epimerase
VFGSPKNRDKGTLDDEAATNIAARFFRKAGALAAEEGVVLCLEPNPPCYGANFMTRSTDTARVVRAVDHPAVRMQWDTGAMTINAEDPVQVAAQVHELVGHVHASEPSLVPLGDGGTDHARMAAVLAGCLPQAIVTIEMVATAQEPHLAAIERALRVAQQHYRHPSSAPAAAHAPVTPA